MAKYRRKDKVVDAVQWNKDGDHPRVYTFGSCRFLRSRDDDRDVGEVLAGDWIVTAADGGERLLFDAEFRDTYEPASPPPAATPLAFRYTNYRGETGDRRVIPKAVRFGSTDHHPEPQWLMDAYDLDKQADRTFAMKDIFRGRGA